MKPGSESQALLTHNFQAEILRSPNKPSPPEKLPRQNLHLSHPNKLTPILSQSPPAS